MRRNSWVLVLVLLLVTPGLAQEEGTPADGKVHCKISFDIKGWAFFYRTADGSGTVTCSNGDRFGVVLEQRGFGLAFGSGEIKDARGVFSPMERTEEVFGTWVGQSAVAGAGGAGLTIKRSEAAASR